MPTGTLKSALFRATTDGWVFRSPNPWLFGDTPHYLVDDAQKARIEEIIALKRPVLAGVLFAVGIVAWTLVVTTLMWALSGHPDPTTSDIVLMTILILMPAVFALPILGIIRRRQLAPILESAKLTDERISYAELRKNARGATPLKQSVNALVASVFACFAALFVVFTHLDARHFKLDAQVVLWSFVAVTFGFGSVIWYRQVMSKVAELEGDKHG
jgi:hypothetical protein